MGEHLSWRQIESCHVGEGDRDEEAHLATCEACLEIARQLEVERAALLAREAPADFARRLRQVAGERERVGRRWLWSGLGAAVAVAALFAVVPSIGESPAGAPDPPPTGRLKGAHPGLAVIVLEGDQQSRHTGETVLKPGSRIRVELTVSTPSVLTVGIRSDDGAWVPLAEARHFERGVHYLDRTLQVDGATTGGVVVVGPPGEGTTRGEGAVLLKLRVGPR